MSQKRKAYRDLKRETLNRLCKSYEAATSRDGLDLIRRESKTRIADKSLVRLLDAIYMEMAIVVVNAERDIRRME